jgi:hypothetical protein
MCLEAIQELVTSCWLEVASLRPSFEDIVNQLENLESNMGEEVKMKGKNVGDFEVNGLKNFRSSREYLSPIGRCPSRLGYT